MNFTVSTVRELKGAPLAVLMLLFLSRVAVTQEWLERNSGYTDKPVSQALAYLREHDWVVRQSTGWVIAEGRQLMLGESRNLSDSNVFIDSQSILNPVESINNNNNKSRNLSDSSMQESDAFAAEVWLELSRVGIRRNVRTEQLVQQAYMVPEYIRRKGEEYKRKGGKNWTGALILAMEDHEPVAEVQENEVILERNPLGHEWACRCSACRSKVSRASLLEICPACWSEFDDAGACRCKSGVRYIIRS
jgi:predicted transcriptional regulator